MKNYQAYISGLLLPLLVAVPTCRAIDSSTEMSAPEQNQVKLPEALNAPYPEEASIPELNAQQRHYDALRAYLGRTTAPVISPELNLAEKLAAAKSAWALGLVKTARDLWDQAFNDPAFQGPERSRAMLARSMLELQEGECVAAQNFAANGMQGVDDSDLKAQFSLVRGEAMATQKAYDQALAEYQQAAKVGNEDTKAEAAFLAAETQRKLGRLRDARTSLTAIETESPYAARGLRLLAEIDLADQNYQGVVTWLNEAREGFSSEFQDAWTSYGLVTAESRLGKFDEAEKELKSFQAAYSSGDTWYALAEATYEAQRLKTELASSTAAVKKAPEKITEDTKGQTISDVEQRNR